jgi:dihydrolipoamide dehydrogenase
MKKRVKEYDVVVIGSGSGDTIVDGALAQDLHVAWIDRSRLGGTCLTVGCIPSKNLIFPADRIVEIQEAKKLGIDAEIKHIDFKAIMEHMRRVVSESQDEIREGIEQAQNLDYYKVEAHFIDRYTLQVGDHRIRGKKIFIASGARPLIPPIKGIDQIEYLTNESVLQLDELPTSLLIIGGGYIGVEYGHFFAAMGTKVTIVQRNERLVPNEEPEISELLRDKLAQRMDVHLQTEITQVSRGQDGILLTGRDTRTGEEKEFAAEQVLVAVGRKSNADLLQVENAGIEMDVRGYVKTNAYLETNVENVWALGDATGKYMFKHVANREAAIIWHNLVHDHKAEMDYDAIPHAVFSHPQIASVGLTEEKAREQYDVLIGQAKYEDIAKGEAMRESDGFAKAVLEKGSGKILGFHVIGPYAPILIQEVIDAMANEVDVGWVAAGLHIHPALPELAVATLYNLREPD